MLKSTTTKSDYRNIFGTSTASYSNTEVRRHYFRSFTRRF